MGVVLNLHSFLFACLSIFALSISISKTEDKNICVYVFTPLYKFLSEQERYHIHIYNPHHSQLNALCILQFKHIFDNLLYDKISFLDLSHSPQSWLWCPRQLSHFPIPTPGFLTIASSQTLMVPPSVSFPRTATQH